MTEPSPGVTCPTCHARTPWRCALSITAQGKALASGAQGDPVRVVNLATNRTLDAVVDAPGIVRIAAP